jgi:hypothetical protein
MQVTPPPLATAGSEVLAVLLAGTDPHLRLRRLLLTWSLGAHTMASPGDSAIVPRWFQRAVTPSAARTGGTRRRGGSLAMTMVPDLGLLSWGSAAKVVHLVVAWS